MKRRKLITLLGGTAAAWPFAAWGQQPGVPVVGILLSGSSAVDAFRIAAIERGLNAMGFITGQNVAFEYRWAENHYDRLPRLAAELVARRVAVLVTAGNAATLAAKRATTEIPVVFEIGTDPVQLGLVASLARPEGNLTGVTFLGASLVAKQFELLHETVPNAATLGFLENPSNPTADSVRREVQVVAAALGQTLVIAKASVDGDLEPAFAALAQQQVGGLLIRSDILFMDRVEQLAALAARHALPAIHPLRAFAFGAGLMSYGASLTDALREVGVYAGHVLKGEKVADLPIQQSARIELVVNLKAAKRLGVKFLLGRADEVIE